MAMMPLAQRRWITRTASSSDQLHHVREYCDALGNLFLLGLNGQHRYNNSDHSMLTTMIAVDNIVAGRSDKTNIWEVNTEQDYHEAKRADPVR